jgi:hypothetical protein
MLFISSAKYGLLELDQIIAPYEMTLNTMTEAEKKCGSRWYWMFTEEGGFEIRFICLFLLGMNYRKYLLPELQL